MIILFCLTYLHHFILSLAPQSALSPPITPAVFFKITPQDTLRHIPFIKNSLASSQPLLSYIADAPPHQREQNLIPFIYQLTHYMITLSSYGLAHNNFTLQSVHLHLNDAHPEKTTFISHTDKFSFLSEQEALLQNFSSLVAFIYNLSFHFISQKKPSTPSQLSRVKDSDLDLIVRHYCGEDLPQPPSLLSSFPSQSQDDSFLLRFFLDSSFDHYTIKNIVADITYLSPKLSTWVAHTIRLIQKKSISTLTTLRSSDIFHHRHSFSSPFPSSFSPSSPLHIRPLIISPLWSISQIFGITLDSSHLKQAPLRTYNDFLFRLKVTPPQSITITPHAIQFSFLHTLYTVTFSTTPCHLYPDSSEAQTFAFPKKTALLLRYGQVPYLLSSFSLARIRKFISPFITSDQFQKPLFKTDTLSIYKLKKQSAVSSFFNPISPCLLKHILSQKNFSPATEALCLRVYSHFLRIVFIKPHQEIIDVYDRLKNTPFTTGRFFQLPSHAYLASQKIDNYPITYLFVEDIPFIPGHDLQYVLKTCQNYDQTLRHKILPLLPDLAEQLKILSELGVCHNDLNARNIMLRESPSTTANTPTNSPIIIDWGISKYTTPHEASLMNIASFLALLIDLHHLKHLSSQSFFNTIYTSPAYQPFTSYTTDLLTHAPQAYCLHDNYCLYQFLLDSHRDHHTFEALQSYMQKTTIPELLDLFNQALKALQEHNTHFFETIVNRPPLNAYPHPQPFLERDIPPVEDLLFYDRKNSISKRYIPSSSHYPLLPSIKSLILVEAIENAKKDDLVFTREGLLVLTPEYVFKIPFILNPHNHNLFHLSQNYVFILHTSQGKYRCSHAILLRISSAITAQSILRYPYTPNEQKLNFLFSVSTTLKALSDKGISIHSVTARNTLTTSPLHPQPLLIFSDNQHQQTSPDIASYENATSFITFLMSIYDHDTFENCIRQFLKTQKKSVFFDHMVIDMLSHPSYKNTLFRILNSVGEHLKITPLIQSILSHLTDSLPPLSLKSIINTLKPLSNVQRHSPYPKPHNTFLSVFHAFPAKKSLSSSLISA